MSSQDSVSSTSCTDSIANDPNNKNKQMPDDSFHENEIDSANEGTDDVPNNSNLTLGLSKKECPFCDKTYARFNKARLHIYQQHQKEVEARSKKDQGRERVYNNANIEKYEKRGYQIVVKYGCVSCIDTFDTKPKLARHVNKTHLIQPPPMPLLATSRHWELDGNNISKKFIAYRQSCLGKSKTASFTIDGNFNELLSMSGVLVLQKRYNYQSFPVNIFPPDLLRSMHVHVIGSYSRCSFNPQILCQVMAIIQKYTDGQIDEENAKIDLLNCARIAETNERVVINAVVELMSNLYDCDVKTLSEAHLAASYIHPFIHGLLSCKMPTTIAHCSNTVPDERPGRDNRPDYKVDIYMPGYKYNYTNVYGEIKPTVNMSPTLLANDFYRTAIFTKDALDIFHLRQSLAFQAIGRRSPFLSCHSHILSYIRLPNWLAFRYPRRNLTF